MAIEKSNKNVRNIAIGVLFLLVFIYLINPLARSALMIYLLFLGITIVVYSLRDYQKDLIGITGRKLGVSMFIAGIIAGVYYIITRFFPSFAILYPSLPNAVGDSLRLFVVIAVAPVVEELVFRGSLLGYLRSFQKPSRKRVWFSIMIVAGVFAIFHIVAYAGQIYDLPGFSAIATAFSANLSAFISAFIAGIIFGYIAVKTDNLASPIFAHMLLNLIIYTTLNVIA